MKILYACRVFSGFETSVESGVWSPTGAPTIYHMIDALDRSDHDVRFVMTGTEGLEASAASGPKDRPAEIRLDGLTAPILLLPRSGAYPSLMSRLAPHIEDMRQVWRLWWEYRRFRPDLVYVDRANLYFGALAARMGARVLLRVMGVYPSMWTTLTDRRPSARLHAIALKSPFAQVVCTEDGTAGEAWMQQALASGVPRRMMLNGVVLRERPPAADDRLKALPKDRMIALFVGRLESIKGCTEFVEAALRLQSTHQERMHFVVVGTGALEVDLKRRVGEAGAEDFVTFIERLPHAQIAEAHSVADVYVSLNKLGNLSNANLEVLRQGICTVVLESDTTHGPDAVDALMPEGALIKIPRDEPVTALADTLKRLCDTPAERAAHARIIGEAAAEKLADWPQRVSQEMDLLEQMVAR